MKKLSKKKFEKKKKKNPDAVHWEGNYYCACRIRNYRKWLAIKRHGKEENE